MNSPQSSRTRSQTIARAARVVGLRRLAGYLNVPAALLFAWMSGAEVPTDAFLKAVDLVDAEVVQSLRHRPDQKP